MIAHRFRGRNASVPTFLAETGHRHLNPQGADDLLSGQSPEPAGQSPPFIAAPLPSWAAAVSPGSPASSPMPPARNVERIAADRQKITEGGVLDLLLDHVHGRQELSLSQISTAFGLLKKILPDFSNSAAPHDSEESSDDEQTASPDFEIHIVDPQEG